MHATKEAILANEHERDVRSTIFYMDLRAAGKNFQTYVARAKDQYSVSYVRARPGLVEEVEGTDDVRVVYENTELRKKTDEVFDLVVLCQAMIPSKGATQLAETLGIELDEHGFISTPSPLAAPVDTTKPGLLAIGYAASPQDIPDSVVQASAAAGRVAELLRGRVADE
jgi:heterodisulfide reductase subunit A